jgi:hypothetical protein
MFPGPSAQIYHNEAGEVLGWDYAPDEPEWDDEWDEGWTEADEDFPRGTTVTISGESGVAFHVLEVSSDGERLHVRMVGDDRVHTIYRDDVDLLDREDFCGQCGQVGCAHDGMER